MHIPRILTRTWLAALMAAPTMVTGLSTAHASPSGLNNIPTADVAPTGVPVVQVYTTLAEGNSSHAILGVKYGATSRVEIGVDSGVGKRYSPAFQAKLQVPLRPGLPDLALGVANLSTNTARDGEPAWYAVVSTKGRLRGHAGHILQANNPALFVGADYAASQSLMLRADWIQTNDREDSTASLGFMRSFGRRVVFEGWASFPSASGAKTAYTIKLNYVLGP